MKKKTQVFIYAAIITLCIIAVIIWLIFRYILPEHFKYSNILGVHIPYSSEVVQAADTHGGFNGDSDYFAEFVINKEELNDFANKLAKKWDRMPLPEDLNKFIFGYEINRDGRYEGHEGHSKNIPSNIKHGLYYFKDRYAELYPEEAGKSMLDRRAYNFTFSILDLDSGKLYIVKSQL